MSILGKLIALVIIGLICRDIDSSEIPDSCEFSEIRTTAIGTRNKQSELYTGDNPGNNLYHKDVVYYTCYDENHGLISRRVISEGKYYPRNKGYLYNYESNL